MSTVSGRPPTRPRPPRDLDPYPYGWRDVAVTGPDGTEALERVALTLEDVLHPEPGDFIVQTDAHDSERAYLKAVFKTRLTHDATVVVLSDCGVDFNIRGVKHLCPDVAVFFGVRRHISWSIFDVAAEGARPGLVVEVTSPSTRSNDLGIKMDYYHRAKVPWYVIADVVVEEGEQRRIELKLYRRMRTGYRRVKPDKKGRVWLEPVGLWLGQTRDPIGGFMRLACFDPQTGEEVGDYTAISQALAESQRLLVDAERRAEADARALAEALARIRELEASARLKRPRRRGS